MPVNMIRRIIVCLVILGCAALYGADTLVNKKTGRVVDLGRAKVERQTIHWSPCDEAGESKDYPTRLYQVVKGENCNIGQLPKTGTSLPLIGMLGALFLAAGLLVRLFRMLWGDLRRTGPAGIDIATSRRSWRSDQNWRLDGPARMPFR